MQTHKHTNSLVNETSPYLLQHAHNPVDWNAWNKETLIKAVKENKLLLISIGYSACHWCHVMEHESFEDEQVAEIMNKHFINIKIDREERPDIDQVYMSAVQLMTGHGGWPLNCIALPDGRPIFGGTYFPKDKWMHVLKSIADLFINDYDRVSGYASELTTGMLKAEQLVVSDHQEELSRSTLEKSALKWKQLFDRQEGGMARAPKFPMPNNYAFLLHYGVVNNDDDLLKQVHLTLKKMAFGGIYDQLGGGFARYSVDALWKVPHFEKMLYDNAQLVSLYSQAFRASENVLYKRIVEDTIIFIERELTHEEGFLFSALDADSEGVEGKFYIWTREEIEFVLDKEEYEVISEFFNINEIGYWEHNQYILLKKETRKEFCLRKQITGQKLDEIITSAKSKLMTARDKRIRPGLDDKTLCSWNALMITAYCEAYRALGNESYLQKAIRLSDLILNKLSSGDRLLHSYKNGEARITGFLEDYAFVIEALINVYEISARETYLHKAKSLTDYCIKHFKDNTSPYFYFNSDEDDELLIRKVEMSDNVIPASNSQMARNLFKLHKYLYVPEFSERVQKMVSNIQDEIVHYGPGYSNWAALHCEMSYSYKEVVVVGKNGKTIYLELSKKYLPNVLCCYTPEASNLPLFEGRFAEDKTFIYVCENNTCKMPVESIKEALKLINE